MFVLFYYSPECRQYMEEVRPEVGPLGPGSSTPIMPSPQDSNTSSGDNMYPMMKPTSAMSGVRSKR